MKRPWGLYFFAVGFALLLLQFFVLLFGYVNNDYTVTSESYAILQEATFLDVIKDIWSGIAGIILFAVLFIRRLLKTSDTLLMLVGIMLWIIQILALRGEGMDLIALFIKFAIGVAGLVFIVIATLIDIYAQKNKPEEEKDNIQ